MDHMESASVLIEAAISMNRNKWKRPGLIAIRDQVRTAAISKDCVLLQCVDV